MLVGSRPDDFSKAERSLKDQTPPPMNTMLEKQSREDALKKLANRKAMITMDVLPTSSKYYKLYSLTDFLFQTGVLHNLCANNWLPLLTLVTATNNHYSLLQIQINLIQRKQQK